MAHQPVSDVSGLEYIYKGSFPHGHVQNLNFATVSHDCSTKILLVLSGRLMSCLSARFAIHSDAASSSRGGLPLYTCPSHWSAACFVYNVSFRAKWMLVGALQPRVWYFFWHLTSMVVTPRRPTAELVRSRSATPFAAASLSEGLVTDCGACAAMPPSPSAATCCCSSCRCAEEHGHQTCAFRPSGLGDACLDSDSCNTTQNVGNIAVEVLTA